MNKQEHGPSELRGLLWEAINLYSANRADLNARSRAVARINEIVDALLAQEPVHQPRPE